MLHRPSYQKKKKPTSRPLSFFNEKESIDSNSTQSVSKVRVVKINVPSIVESKDIDKNGNLIISKNDAYLLAANHSKFAIAGRYSKEETGLSYDTVSFKDLNGDLQIGLVYKKHLGLGNHGKVELMQIHGSQTFCALKTVYNESKDKNALAQHMTAVRTEHNILKTFNLSPARNPILPIKTGDTNSMIIMELAEGITMENHIELELQNIKENEEYPHALIPPVIRIQMVIEFLKALDEINKNKIVHRDLQMGNVVLNFWEQNVKIIDFGLARYLDAKSDSYRGKIQGTTIHYTAKIRAKLKKAFEARLDENNQDNQNPDVKDPSVDFKTKTDFHAAMLVVAEFLHLMEYPPEPDGQSEEDKMKNLILDWEDRSYIAENTESDFFIENDTLPEKQRAQVLELLHEGTLGFPYNPVDNEDENNQLTYELAIERLEKIKKKLLDAPDGQIKVAVVNVKDFLNLKDNAKDDFIAQLKTKDEVWLIDTETARLNSEYHSIQNELGQKGLRVSKEVFVHPDESKADKELNVHLSKRPIPSVCERIYVECEPQPKVGKSIRA